MPRVVQCAIFSELENAILTAAPKRTLLPYNNVLYRAGSGAAGSTGTVVQSPHTAYAGTVDDACVHLAEPGLDVVVCGIPH